MEWHDANVPPYYTRRNATKSHFTWPDGIIKKISDPAIPQV